MTQIPQCSNRFQWAIEFPSESQVKTIDAVLWHVEEEDGGEYQMYRERMDEEGDEPLGSFEWLIQSPGVSFGPDLVLEDLSPLVILQNLAELELTVAQGTDLSPLGQLAWLSKLELHALGEVDAEFTTTLSRLLELHVYAQGLKDLSVLRTCPSLKKLTVRANLSSLDGIEKLSHLEFLHVADNALADLAPLTHLPELKYLFLQNNRITDLRALARLTKLHRLELSNNCIADFSPIESLPELASDLDRLRRSPQRTSV